MSADSEKNANPSAGKGHIFLGTGSDAPIEPAPEQLARVYRLNDPALLELPLDSLLDELLVRVKEILEVDTVAILLIDEEGEMLIARAAKGLEEEVELGVRIPIGGGFAGRIAAERMPIFIGDVDLADVLNPLLREKGIRSMLGVPLVAEAELLGVLHVGTLTPRTFTNDDAAMLQLAAGQVAPAIQRAALFEALETEHRRAVALQRSLLPERVPEIVGVPVAARYFPARDEVGGDWYDVIELAQGRVAIAIGDVVGHGVRAAALMGQLRTALRAYALEDYSPGQALERLDRLLQSIRGRGMATAAHATFDPDNGKLHFASAGHPPPLVIAPGEEPRLIETAPAAPLGALPYSTYTDDEITLAEGEIFVLYTDGLVEVRGEAIDAGFERLIETVRGAATPEQACRQLVRELVPREGAADDIAFVALQREPVTDKLLLRLPASPSVLVQVRRALRRWLRAYDVASEKVDFITLACGEACANAIEHAYSPATAFFELEAKASNGTFTFAVRDLGQWRPPRGENRGRGLTIMESVMDGVDVNSTSNGTEVLMRMGAPA
jgi:anti-sigma regulatory factor (Ser/Thr protein kinase)/putative methionine-R-sulfoxide reductase with GAF domain